MAKRRKTLN